MGVGIRVDASRPSQPARSSAAGWPSCPSRPRILALSPPVGVTRLLVHVDHAAVRVVELLHAAGGVGEARRVLHLEALGRDRRADRSRRPQSSCPSSGGRPSTDKCRHWPRTLRGCGRPVNQCTVSIWWTSHWSGMPDEYGQNSRNSRYLRASKGTIVPVEQIALPVRVLFLQQRHNVGPAPAAGLVHVPGHLHHHDVAELA